MKHFRIISIITVSVLVVLMIGNILLLMGIYAVVDRTCESRIQSSLEHAAENADQMSINMVDNVFRQDMTTQHTGWFKYYGALRMDSHNRILEGDSLLLNSSNHDFRELTYNDAGDKIRIYLSSVDNWKWVFFGPILAVNVLILSFIIFAFWYLYRSVVKLRDINEMKDDFVNNMTHELKTPIAIAYSANESLLNNVAKYPIERQTRYLQASLNQLNRLSGLVESILSMSMERRKTLAFQPETIDLVSFTEAIVENQRLRKDKQIEIKVESTAETIDISADPNHLGNVLNNLLDNAIKYSDESVCIKVDLSPDYIKVSDNGIGITAKQLPHIFEKFYRVPNGKRQDVKGYGIGLFYVKSILDKMSWTISVESKEFVGTAFTIKFEQHGKE